MAEGDVELRPVDIDDPIQLLLKYDEVEKRRGKHHSGSIFMVPSVYRDISPHSYTLRVVSIGPLHHRDKHLKAFEVQKATYMHNLLHNILSHDIDSTPEQILKECVAKVSGSVDKIKACYFGMQTYPDSELVKMMIPFFVLEDIYECTFLKLHPTRPLAKHISCILVGCSIFERDLVMDDSSISLTYDHILAFLHESYQNPDSNYSSTVPQIEKAHSVVELVRSGVRFSAKRDAKWPMAMELKYSRFLCSPLSWSKPTLKMPVLKIDDHTEFILRNLIIYEQSSNVEEACVTSYVFALDCLIDTPEDVAMLVRSQVLVNYLGTDDEAAELRGKYFSNPWSIIALIAGIVLFVLTVVQTVYGVKAV
ncbi:UPF0481 protein-like protein [Tanacetum coccineum]